MGVDHRRSLMPRGSTEAALLAGVLAVVGAFALVPAVDLFARSFVAAGGWAGLERLVASPPARSAFRNSLLQGGLSGALAVAIGYPAGVFVGRYRWPGREIVRSALLLPFLLPSLVMVLGVLDLLGPQGIAGGPWPAARWFSSGMPGVVAVNLFYNVPIVVVLTATGCEASSSSQEETIAALGGTPARAYLETWAAPSWTGALGGGLLTFVLSALSFAPPILLCGDRCSTVEVLVYNLAEVAGQPAQAGALALVLVAAFLVPALAYIFLVRRLAPSRGRSYRPRRPVWTAPATWALAGTFVAVAAAELALVGAVVLRSIVPAGGGPVGRGWTGLFAGSTAGRIGISVEGAVGNTLFFAALAAAVGIVVAIASSFVTSRRPQLTTGVGLALFVPVLLSPVVLAEALEGFWGPIFGGTADLWVLIVVSQALLAVPFALQSLQVPLFGLAPAGAESAQALGATPWGAFVDADLPRVRRGIRTALLFAFALGLGEFTATYFLVTSTTRFRTLPVAIYALTDDRLYAAAGAATALLLALSLAVLAVVVAGRRDDDA